jgi:hypothetical protein
MAPLRFTEEEITARARQLANEQGPGSNAITAEEPTVLETEANTPRTAGLDASRRVRRVDGLYTMPQAR